MVKIPDDDRHSRPDTAMVELDTSYLGEFKKRTLEHSSVEHSSEKNTKELEELKKKKRSKKK